jgi:flagellar motor switch protein FliM
VIEPIMGKLAAQNWFSYQKKDTGDEYLKKLTTNVTNASVEVRALLAQTKITMRDLLSLQVGDLITTDKPEAQDLLILVEGKNKFQGQVGKLRENKAVRITRHCKSGSEAAAGLGGKAHPVGGGTGGGK